MLAWQTFREFFSDLTGVCSNCVTLEENTKWPKVYVKYFYYSLFTFEVIFVVWHSDKITFDWTVEYSHTHYPFLSHVKWIATVGNSLQPNVHTSHRLIVSKCRQFVEKLQYYLSSSHIVKLNHKPSQTHTYTSYSNDRPLQLKLQLHFLFLLDSFGKSNFLYQNIKSIILFYKRTASSISKLIVFSVCIPFGYQI